MGKDKEKERAAWQKYLEKNRAAIYERNRKRYQNLTQTHREKRCIEESSKPFLLKTQGTRKRSGKIVVCLNCKKEFYPFRMGRDSKFCCYGCYLENGNKKSTYQCVVCSNEFKATPYQRKTLNKQTCSRKCYTTLVIKRNEERALKTKLTKTKINYFYRTCSRMKEWRKAVFERDNYTCQKCGLRSQTGSGSVYIQAHHIKQFAYHPELRFEVSNGVTLCKPCHKKEPHVKLPKVKSVKELVKELDSIFSRFVRLRDSDKYGVVSCFTCGVKMDFKKSQCGHFLSRRHYAVRWEEKNTAVQCVRCNIFKQGEQFIFSENLKKKYGENVIEILNIRKNNTCKLEKFTLQTQIQHYSDKVKELKEKLNITE